MARAANPGIERLNSGHYRWRIMVDGINHSGTARTEAAAMRARLDVQLQGRQVAEGEIDPTVHELVAMWLADVEHASATAKVRDHALRMVPAAFMARRAIDVTPPSVAAMWRQMAQATGPHVVIKARNALSKAFEMGVEFGIVPTNPIAQIKPKQPPKSGRVHAPSVEDVNRLSASLRDRPTLAAWVRTMSVCGARPGELCAIQWDDLDANTSTMRIERAVDRAGNIVVGKNGETGHRTVQLDLPTFTALRRVDRTVGCPWVFTFDGMTPWNPERPAREIRRECQRLEIVMRPYALRHFAASQALAAGVPVPEVAEMLGDNPATVMKVYAHAIPRAGGAASVVAAALDAY